MRVGRNLIAGLTSSILTAALGLLVVPLYIRRLGIESYGLIAFFTTLQALLQILDLGLAPTINREVARASHSGDMRDVRNLLHTLAAVYWAMAVSIGIIVIVLARPISQHWLQSSHLPAVTVQRAVMLMGVVIACRWPVGLYQGVLLGAQRLTIASAINMINGALASLGAVAVLEFVSPTVQTFFIWQVCVGIGLVVAFRSAAWSVLGGARAAVAFDVVAVKRVWRFSAGMIYLTLAGLIFTQMDKLILSKFLPLEQFGNYALATVVANGLLLISTPLFNVLFPRFSALVAAQEQQRLVELYRLSTRLVASLLFPAALILVMDAKDVLHLWTGNVVLASKVAPILALLVSGTAIHCVMYVPHALQLAFGLTRLPLMINGILLVVMVPIIIVSVLAYGAMGAATAWLVLHILYMLLGTWLTHRELLKGMALKWLCNDVGLPLLVVVAFGAVGTEILQAGRYSEIGAVAVTVAFSIAAFVTITALSPKLRGVVVVQMRLLLDRSTVRSGA